MAEPCTSHSQEHVVVCLHNTRVSKHAVLVTRLLDLRLSRGRGFCTMAWHTHAVGRVSGDCSVTTRSFAAGFTIKVVYGVSQKGIEN